LGKGGRGGYLWVNFAEVGKRLAHSVRIA